MKYLWDTEHPAGHAPYCAHPFHSLTHYCSADEAEPQTLHGEPSKAWHADHPDMFHEGYTQQLGWLNTTGPTADRASVILEQRLSTLEPDPYNEGGNKATEDYITQERSKTQ